MSATVNRVAIVTGASGALGSAVCKALREDGLDVVGVDITGAPEVVADVSTEAGNIAMISAALERHGRLDILVLNAGTQRVAPLGGFSTEDWDQLHNLMCRGPFIAIRSAWPSLVASKAGRIVVISSTNAIAAEPNKAAYNSAKAGVLGLVKTAAIEGIAFGLTANAIAPGWMHTDQLERQLDDQVQLKGGSRQEVIDGMLSRMPVKRFVDPREVAVVVRFLVSPEASAVNGALVPVDLGLLAC